MKRSLVRSVCVIKTDHEINYFNFLHCRSNIMADRDIPSVPITTLAGLTSLSDRK